MFGFNFFILKNTSLKKQKEFLKNTKMKLSIFSKTVLKNMNKKISLFFPILIGDIRCIAQRLTSISNYMVS